MGRNLPPLEILDALRALGLLAAGETVTGEALTGGVSSDIWRIDLASGPICAKRALSRLKVAAVWEAPVIRNQYEAGWMRRAEAAVPGATPGLLGQVDGVLAMKFLSPDRYRLWKTALRNGEADQAFAAAVAGSLVRIHAATLDAADEFPTDAIFRAIRLEPYLLATGAAHPDLAGILSRLVATTEAQKHALVHGDVSPKNILIGPDGPVFLDAECAWFGDPAFDLAFCLNHLLLKCLWNTGAVAGFLACFDGFVASYLAGVTWEARSTLEARAAHLLPGLLLARVDGKSPVEYITSEADRATVRSVARALLLAPVDRLAAVRTAWAKEIAA